MKKLLPLIIGGFMFLGVVACDNNAKTSQNAPNNTNTVGQAPQANQAQDANKDATNDTRQKQLESDIRAREQRNDALGGDTKRADGDLESEVRSKLEANLPASKLTVDAKNGAVTVSGTVPTQQQHDRIATLAQEIKGVKSVSVKATVAPAKPAS